MPRKYLVVGSGLSGSTFARTLHGAGHEVHVIEQRSHVGGNVFDQLSEGLYRHTYGPHLFHTNSKKVVCFLSQYTDWAPYTHRVKAEVHGQYVDFPVNLRTVEQLFPPALSSRIQSALLRGYGFNSKVSLAQLYEVNDPVLNEFADFVYENFVENYSAKAWGTDVRKLDPEILKRIPVRVNYDDRYFEDKFQAQPARGFTTMVNRMLGLHGNLDRIKVDVDTKFEFSMLGDYDKVYFTGCIDALFNHKLGALPYRGLDFNWFRAPTADQIYTVVNHPDHMKYTRTTNFGLTAYEDKGRAWFCQEEPRAYNHADADDIPYYPVRSDESRELYRKYQDLAESESKFIFGGRLGRFEYLNMDQAVAQALKLAELEIAR